MEAQNSGKTLKLHARIRGPVGPRGAPPAQRWVADRAINVTIRSPITLGPNWDRFTPLVSLEYFVFSGSFDG